MRNINYLVVHCTATNQNTTINSIKNYWRSVLKWRNPGYHVIVKADGTPVEILPIERISNGVKGFNAESLHISYIGGVDAAGRPHDTRTTAQKATLNKYLTHWRKMFPKATIQGHRDFPGVTKACPSFNAKLEYKAL